MNESEIRGVLTERLAARLKIDARDLDPRERFSRYGLDSAGATALIAELSAELGRTLSPTLVWAHPSVDELARHLAAGDTAPVASVAAGWPPRTARTEDPIAIVGMSCRFPGAPDPRAYWRLLCDGVDATRTVPPDRWDADAWYDPDPQAPGTINTRRGAFLDRIDQFDPLFFGISPREAAEMDPQQRMMLELAWEALEDAGIPPRSLAGTKAGVFVGVIVRDYADLHRASGAPVTSHTGPGTSLSIVANRISYVLGLRGPSLSVDTACSSSLVSVHLACQSLREGESTVALAGGVNLMLYPGMTVELTKFGGLSGDGRCKAFDARADGFARGEGAGLVVLKPLAKALADGDPVYCVIRGGAVNNDGFSNGLTAPNPQAQIEVLTDAYARAGVDPSRVHYVEAHGTGTQLGDPIEARALSAVLCAGRDPERPLVVGSAKTNVAHLEGAAGIAGLIKLALAIRHRTVPPSLHFERPNPDIPFEELRLRVQTALGPWPAEEGLAIGGVSSFGWGGTNCHLILEEIPRSRTQILLLSAEDPEALRERARSLREAPSLAAVCADLCRAIPREPRRPHRLAMAVRTERGLAERLDAFLAGQSRPGLAAGREGESGRLVFVFSGMGSQWRGMALDLLRSEPVFRACLERCDRAMRPWVGWPLLEKLASQDSWGIEAALPMLLAVEIALAELWRSWGIEPDAVVGHSFGEIAAACVAGALSLEEAVRVSVHYSRALGKIEGHGEMGVVAIPPEEAARLAAAEGGRVAVAGWLSPVSAAVAGEPAAVADFLAGVKARGIFAAPVNELHVAAHTAQLEPHLEALREALADLAPRAPRVPLISTLTGEPLDRLLDGEYWAANLRSPVLFAQAMERLLADGHGLFLEIDAHPILATPMEQCFAASGRGRWLPSLRRNEDSRAVLFDSLAALWAAGRPVRGDRLYPSDEAGPVQLVPLSARSPEALRDLARETAAAARSAEEGTVADFAWTAALRRGHHDHRLAMPARSRSELAERLEAFVHGEPPPGAASGRRPREQGGTVFAFSGQGPQWPGMGRQLADEEPVFREVVERCDEMLRTILGFSFWKRIETEENALDHTEVTQPALFALQAGLADLWRSWGIVPDGVVGHSVGEVAAAYVSGALTLEEGARVAALRGLAMEPAKGKGRMAAVELTEAEVRGAIQAAGFPGRLDVAAVNSPSAVTVAGDPEALDGLIAYLQARSVTCRKLRVDFAFHTAQMEPHDQELAVALSSLRPRPPAIPMISTVTGAAVSGAELDGSYWASNVRRPVRFADAAAALARNAVFLEIGPHPVLSVAITQTLDRQAREAAVLASLRRGRDERETLMESLGALYVLGLPVDWRGVHPAGGRQVLLPTYPFQRQRYWFEAPAGRMRPELEPPALTPGPVPPQAVLPEEGSFLEQLLAEQLNAFNQMVSLQLDVLGHAGPEDDRRS